MGVPNAEVHVVFLDAEFVGKVVHAKVDQGARGTSPKVGQVTAAQLLLVLGATLKPATDAFTNGPVTVTEPGPGGRLPGKLLGDVDARN